ncbi:MAG: hypothetical protein Q7U53_18125 [Anaerolineaceae bacterium]|nr:hypothetical protein [Anaerolineaceae bacterium]
MLNNSFKFKFKSDLHQRYWSYLHTFHPDWTCLLDPKHLSEKGPSVFLPRFADFNVITNPGAVLHEKVGLLSYIPTNEHHKWFRSMNSSQALAQSVFGNLAIHGFLEALSDLLDDDGGVLFGRAKLYPENFCMEYKVKLLGEPRPTSLDGYFFGEYRVAMECKFTEYEVGYCSHAHLKIGHPTWCDGQYTLKGRIHRCPLPAYGVKYWQYVPELFEWKNDEDLSPCPLYRNYQLVRNLIAIGVQPDGSVSLDNGHAVLIYDQRNPAFQEHGKGYQAYQETRSALKNPVMLRKVSWQSITELLRRNAILPWLTDELEKKYGL